MVETLNPLDLVDRLYFWSGNAHWVSGYYVFDPDAEFCTFKGFGALKLKERQKPRAGEVLVVPVGEIKPIRLPKERVRLAAAGAVSFEELFGVATRGSVVLSGLEAAEQEDLSLAGDGGFDEPE